MIIARHYDVVIVGGGPSGTTVGTLLARGGLSVVILDKCRFPREKPCAGGISGRCARLIEEVFGADALRRVCRTQSTGCRMFYKGWLVAEITDCEPTWFVDRREMDFVMLREAAHAGCEVTEGTKVIGIEPEQRRAVLASRESVTGSVIVGADGINTRLWKHARSKKAGSRRVGLGLVTEVALEALKDESIRDQCSRLPHIYVGDVPWGYGWVFPKGDCVSIGVAGAMSYGSRLRRAQEKLLEAHCTSGVWEKLPIRGRLFPYGNYEPRPGCGNILLTGDAAGTGDPLTGEGIGFALASAKLAATSITDALAAGTPTGAGDLYNAAYRAAMVPHLRGSFLMRSIVYRRATQPIAMHMLSRHLTFIKSYFDVLAAKIPYRMYFRRLVRELVWGRANRSIPRV